MATACNGLAMQSAVQSANDKIYEFKQTSLFTMLGLVSELSGSHCEGFRKNVYACESEQNLMAS